MYKRTQIVEVKYTPAEYQLMLRLQGEAWSGTRENSSIAWGVITAQLNRQPVNRTLWRKVS